MGRRDLKWLIVLSTLSLGLVSLAGIGGSTSTTSTAIASTTSTTLAQTCVRPLCISAERTEPTTTSVPTTEAPTTTVPTTEAPTTTIASPNPGRVDMRWGVQYQLWGGRGVAEVRYLDGYGNEYVDVVSLPWSYDHFGWNDFNRSIPAFNALVYASEFGQAATCRIVTPGGFILDEQTARDEGRGISIGCSWGSVDEMGLERWFQYPTDDPKTRPVRCAAKSGVCR